MPGAFESVTRTAINELIKKHSNISKFGYILSEESIADLVDDFYQLLLTSRNLKSIGDKMLRSEAIRPENKREKNIF